MFRRKDTMDIQQLLTHIRETSSDRKVHRDLGVARPTVKKFREWAEENGLLQASLPPLEDLQKLLEKSMPIASPPQNTSTMEPFREDIMEFAKKDIPMTAMMQQLRQKGCTGTYWALRRFLRANLTHEPDATVRVETAPGEEAQVDFGYAGLMIDAETGKLRKTWVFVMTLSWSRHQYAEFVHDQKVETWLQLHVNAFAWFGGVPCRLKIDNLKAAIVRAVVDTPTVQRAYRECAEHYGFLISPCRPRTPEHKGKVESGVKYLKGNFVAGRQTTSRNRANEDVKAWILGTAGNRKHGTTREKPLIRFETEKTILQPLPKTSYDLAVWKHLKLHRDCYVVVDDAYYSAPYRLIGQQLWVRRGLGQVRIFNENHELIATHDRAAKPGERKTNLDHLPSTKVGGLIMTPDRCRDHAAEIGLATTAVITEWLNDRVIDRLPTAARLLRLASKFSPLRLEEACKRAISHGDPRYETIKRILRKGLEFVQSVPHIPAPPAEQFVRQGSDLLGQWQETESWN